MVKDWNKIGCFPCSGMLSVFGSRCVMSVKCSLILIFERFQNCRAAMRTDVALAMVVCLECMKSVISE